MLSKPLPHPCPVAVPLVSPAGPPVGGIALAVIIPACRQPGLLVEAITAVLTQSGGPPASAVVVDDGCPFPETTATALDLAAAHPGRVCVLRRRNGGLSAARNTGIDFALAAFPQCRGLFFLDADNRLHPPFLASADAALRAAPAHVGWFYPDFDEFGGHGNWTAAGRFAVLPLLTQNYCEAGSLVRRAVFEAGLRFDETLRQGFEDWDFWLQAAAAGFVGQHMPNAGFRYRRRPESMLAAAERARPALVADLHRRHAAALRPRRLLALEAAEAPRYALQTPARPGTRWLLDPAGSAGEDVPEATARQRFVAAATAPAECFQPPVLVFAAEPALALLRRLGLIRGLFWRAEVLLREAAAVGLELFRGSGDDLVVEGPAAGGLATTPVIFVASRALAAWLAEPWAAAGTAPGIDWLQSLSEDRPHPAVRLLRVTLPCEAAEAAGPSDQPPGDPGADDPGAGGHDLGDAGPCRLLLLVATMLRHARLRHADRPAPWRRDFRHRRDAAAARAQALSGLGTVLPCPPVPGRRSFGFILPIFAFGGVERVVTNQALLLRQHGWRTHLFVLGAGRASLPDAVRAAFEDVTLAAGLGEAAADWHKPYLGAEISGFGVAGSEGGPEGGPRGGPGVADELGLLAGMDAVLNTHSLGGHALMARLRACGVRTFCGLHLVERGGFGNPLGTPHTALAYEHAYDGLTVVSAQLRDWCLAQGVPAAKLHLLRNAPGYPADAARVTAVRSAREAARGGAAAGAGTAAGAAPGTSFKDNAVHSRGSSRYQNFPKSRIFNVLRPAMKLR